MDNSLNFSILEKPQEDNKSILLFDEHREVFPSFCILILKFSRGYDKSKMRKLVLDNSENLQKQKAVFITKQGRALLSGIEIRAITSVIMSINQSIKIFIDQEGGKVKRYEDFSGTNNLLSIHKSDNIAERKYNALDDATKQKVSQGAKSKRKVTFPSLKEIGTLYQGANDKESLCDYMTYMRLKTLKINGINTYGLVCDLDRGNPAISGLERSFSTNVTDYIKLGKSMIDNAKLLGMSIYLKHFPGHGAGKVDSHHGVLTYYRNDITYLHENMGLFGVLIQYAKSAGVDIGLMVGHMTLPNGSKSYPNDIYESFLRIIQQSDYLVTDDLGMKGYTKKKSFSKLSFYTTDEILRLHENIIKLDLGQGQYITD